MTPACASFPCRDAGYQRAYRLFAQGEYEGVVAACDSEIEASGERLAEALLMRATFYLLKGQAVEAKPDLDRLIALEDSSRKVQSGYPVCQLLLEYANLDPVPI